MATDPVMAEMEEEQQRDWRDEITEEYLQLQVAEKAAAMARVERVRQTEEALARFARENAGMSEGNKPETEADMISVGNKTTNYNTYQNTPQQTATLSGVTSGLSKAALVAAILASGGVGSGLTLLLTEWLNQPTVVESNDTDTDTISVIDFPD